MTWDKKEINKRRKCSYLIEPPAGDVVNECLDELEKEIERAEKAEKMLDEAIIRLAKEECPEDKQSKCTILTKDYYYPLRKEQCESCWRTALRRRVEGV